MSTIHLILTGKGGVGKSFIATMLAQWLPEDTFNADTDPSNPTFASYPAIGAKHINIMTKDMNIDKRHFDNLIEELLNHEGDCLVDNGSSSFLPLMAYMIENQIWDLLREAGKTMIIHSVLVGGLGVEETTRGVVALLRSQAAPIVIWENELYGPVVRDEMYFADTEFYAQHKSQIVGIVRIKERDSDTFTADLHEMTSRKLTFKEIAQSKEFNVAMKNRMKIFRTDIFKQLDTLDFSAA